jgi:hypothetical protein
MVKSPVKVVQDVTDPIPTEVIATHIRTIAQGIRALRKGPNTLTDRALYLLVKDAAPGNLTLKEIAAVFSAIDNLERLYVRPA